MNENFLLATLDNQFDIVLVQHCLAVQNNFVSLDGYHFTGIFVGKVFNPALNDTCGQLPAYHFLQIGLAYLDFFSKVEDLKYFAVGFKADGTQEGRYGQFLLTVDIGVHDAVDVCGKFYPRALERDDAG